MTLLQILRPPSTSRKTLSRRTTCCMTIRKEVLHTKLETLRAEHAKMAVNFLKLRGDRAIAVAQEHLARVEGELLQLEHALEPLDQARISILDELRDLDERMKQATDEMRVGTNRQRKYRRSSRR